MENNTESQGIEEIEDVPRGPLEKELDKTVSVKQTGDKNEEEKPSEEVQMREPERQRATEVLPGLSRSVYEELEENSPDVVTAEIARQLPTLRGRVPTERQVREEILRGLPESKQSDASRRLLEAAGGEVVLPSPPPGDSSDLAPPLQVRIVKRPNSDKDPLVKGVEFSFCGWVYRCYDERSRNRKFIQRVGKIETMEETKEDA